MGFVDVLFEGPGLIVDMAAPHAMTIRYVLGAIILLYAIWTDLRVRRVSNKVWLVTLILGALLAGYDLVAGSPDLLYFALVPVVMAFAYLLWRFRLVFGGADAKCIMAFALLIPYPAAVVTGAVVYPHLPVVFPLAITMLTNAVAISLLLPLGYFVANLARGDIHPAAMFLGRRVPLRQIFTEPLWVMDWVHPAPGKADHVEEGPALDDTVDDPDLDDDGLPSVEAETLEGATVRLAYMPTRAGDYALNLARLKAMGVETVWATPKVPFMVPLFLGYVLAFLLGDIVFSATLFAMGRL